MSARIVHIPLIDATRTADRNENISCNPGAEIGETEGQSVPTGRSFYSYPRVDVTNNRYRGTRKTLTAVEEAAGPCTFYRLILRPFKSPYRLMNLNVVYCCFLNLVGYILLDDRKIWPTNRLVNWKGSIR
jgi:hypothetical protein